jgi:hypothetical protein
MQTEKRKEGCKTIITTSQNNNYDNNYGHQTNGNRNNMTRLSINYEMAIILSLLSFLFFSVEPCRCFQVIPFLLKNSRTTTKAKSCTTSSTSSTSSSLWSNYGTTPSGKADRGDPVLRLPLMEAELATLLEKRRSAVEDSTQDDINFEELQNAIVDAKTAAEFGVRKAQLEFYDAFSSGNINKMDEIWSKESHVRCVHPGMSSLEGRDKVMSSWKQILISGAGSRNNDDDDDDEPVFNIEPTRSRVEVHGLIALCSCIEKTEGGGTLEALNIYKREEGGWKMTLHMAGPIAMPMQGGSFF